MIRIQNLRSPPSAFWEAPRKSECGSFYDTLRPSAYCSFLLVFFEHGHMKENDNYLMWNSEGLVPPILRGLLWLTLLLQLRCIGWRAATPSPLFPMRYRACPTETIAVRISKRFGAHSWFLMVRCRWSLVSLSPWLGNYLPLVLTPRGRTMNWSSRDDNIKKWSWDYHTDSTMAPRFPH